MFAIRRLAENKPATLGHQEQALRDVVMFVALWDADRDPYVAFA